VLGSFSQNDGTTSRTSTASGEHLVNISNSNLRSNLQFSESLRQSYTKQASKAKAQPEGQMVAATEAQGSALNSSEKARTAGLKQSSFKSNPLILNNFLYKKDI